MKQRIFKKKYAQQLEEYVEQNMPKYINPDFSWEEDSQGQTIDLDFEQPDLSGMMDYAENSSASSDYYAAKILYEAYKHLTPLQAAQHHFWQYLSHVVLYDYMRKRWPKINNADCPANYVNEHWFYGQGFIRNWLEGMFWSIKCSVIEKEGEEPDYKYTEFLFSIQKIRDRGIAAAPYILSNPAAVRGMIRFYMDELEKKEKGEDTVFEKYFEYRTDKCIQLVNKLGGVVELATYDEDDFYNFLNDNRDIIKGVGDRKKEKKERDAQLEAQGILPQKKNSKSKNKKRKKT